MFSDLRFSVRQLAKSPGFAGTAVLTLALGIGAASAIFTLVQGLLLRPLPFARQADLVLLRESTPQNPSTSVAYPNFVDWRARQHSFTALGAVRTQDFNITGGDESERVAGAMVSHGFFVAVGVRPVHGRLFNAAEDAPAAARTVLVRESLARRRFAVPATAPGQELAIDGQPYTIVGVIADAFVFPDNATELWVPVGLWADDYRNRRQHPGLSVIARLRPGVTIAAARADLDTIARQLAAEYPDSNRSNGVRIQPLTSFLFRDIQSPLLVLSAAATCVLLIACANVAGLLLIRASLRRRELAVRAALGAARVRLLRLLLAEGLVFGFAGATGGFLASCWIVDALKAVLPAATPRLAEVGTSPVVLAFNMAVGLATGIAFGLVPGWRASRPDVARELAHAGPAIVATHQRLRMGLIVTEYALTVMLLLGAGLMLRTLQHLQRGDLGFPRERVLTFGYDLPRYAFRSGAERLEAEQRIFPRLAALPGVAAIGYSSALPLSNRANYNGFTVEGTGDNSAADLPMADTANVSPGFFAALGVTLVRGRDFAGTDGPSGRPVAVIDTLFAERFFPGKNPVGRRLKIGDAASDQPWLEIVGVVEHVAKYGLTREAGPQLYRPARQVAGVASFTFAMRTSRDAGALAADVRAVFREQTPTVPVFDFQTMEDRFAASIWSRRLPAVLLSLFAGLAAVLAAVGLFGVVSFSVVQRTRELGIRLALGASPRDLLRRVLQQGIGLAMLGTAIGLVASVGMAQALRGLLYGVSPLDAATFIAVPMFALGLGLVACWWPARRATRIDPVEALRAE
jgi:predicted permease